MALTVDTLLTQDSLLPENHCSAGKFGNIS